MSEPPVYLHRIGTAVPEHTFSQPFLCEQMLRWADSERQRRIIRGIYPTSGIDTRHFVVSDRTSAPTAIYTPDGPNAAPANPGTAARNALYVDAARRLAEDAGRRAIDACGDIDAADVTHVILVSCTGFCNPGPDIHVVRTLGIPADAQRYCLGFMGCHAALPALRMAAQFCCANPKAVVLVVSVELCSLHLQFDGSLDALLGNALFSDGAAAAVVSARRPLAALPAYGIHGFATTLVPEGGDSMAWSVGDHGFRLTLSSYVSRVIGASIRPVLAQGLSGWGIGFDDVDRWAVHPGGKTILDRIETELALPQDMLQASREVLRRHGNMSSATALFVLQELLDSGAAGTVLALAFGPGLTVETAHLSLH